MAKLVFLYHSFQQEYGLFGHFAKKNSTWSPLNLALLAAVCEQAGHEVEIIDAEAIGIDNKELARRGVASKPDIVALTAYSPFFHLVSDIAKDVKRLNPELPVMVGGPHISIMKEQAFNPEFDFAFMGEAENSLPEFLEELRGKRQYGKVKGLIYRQDGETISTGEPAWLTETSMKGRDLGKWYPLDALPLPARHLLPMEKYFLGTTQTGRSHFASIQSFRGCPWKCVTADTDILLEDGSYAKAESIAIGDRVVCSDIDKNLFSVGTVVQTGSREADDIYRLTLSDGTTLNITGDHPVWTKAGWLRVGGLQKGQSVFSVSYLRNGGSHSAIRDEHMRGTEVRKRENPPWQVGRFESNEAAGSGGKGFALSEGSIWANQFGENASAQLGRAEQYAARFGSKEANVPTDETVQSYAYGGNRGAHGGNKEGDAQSRIATAAVRQDQQNRIPVGRDFCEGETAREVCGRQEVLDRAWTIGQETQSGLHPYDNQAQTGHSIQRKVLAYARKYRGAPNRLYHARLDGPASVGQCVPENKSQISNPDRTRVFGSWISIADITFMGRGLVYAIAVEPHKNFFANNVCVHNCNFCASDLIKTTRVIMKSPKRVVEEMAQIKEKWPFISHLYLVDDVILLWPQHITEIVDRMDAEGLKFTFEGSTRANTVTEDLIKRLAKSGLVRLSFGLETIDPVMRVTMGKKVNILDYPRSNKICADNGVEAMNSLMIGLPGETRETIKNTVYWVRDQKDIKQANVAVAIPYPGTEFHDQAVAGTHGVELLSKSLSEYLRYGSAVTRVNGMEPSELVSWQNWAFIQIYLMAPHRWWPVIRKHGITGFFLQFIRLFRLIKDIALDRCRPFIYPGKPA